MLYSEEYMDDFILYKFLLARKNGLLRRDAWHEHY